ncbi:MAG: hypothetical protein QM597_05055 [Aeromicrobium sp.]|uniref:hypothetical protein n=1 Tax=Aeromicrobium sp. TaxID=1871063 RepID=UPI0039E40668
MSRRRMLGMAGATTALVLGLLSFGVQAAALVSNQLNPVEEVGDLTVSAGKSPATFFDLTPGDRRYWSVEASLVGADVGTLALRLWGDGALVNHPDYPLHIAVDACNGTLSGDDGAQYPVCSGSVESVVAEQPLRDVSVASDLSGGQVWDLAPITRNHARSFIVTLAVPPGGSYDESLMGLSGDFGVGLYSSGDVDQSSPQTETPSSSDPATTATGILPSTGGPFLALLLIGVGVIGLGVIAHSRGSEVL